MKGQAAGAAAENGNGPLCSRKPSEHACEWHDKMVVDCAENSSVCRFRRDQAIRRRADFPDNERGYYPRTILY